MRPGVRARTGRAHGRGRTQVCQPCALNLDVRESPCGGGGFRTQTAGPASRLGPPAVPKGDHLTTASLKNAEASEGVAAPRYPGIASTVDGSGAVVWVDSNIAQGACAYPITPSTPMGDGFAVEFANGKKNLWGEPLQFLEPESEHSSASACEGFALAGGRVSNFTSGQGLILMKEVLYVIAGKRLPAVFHIGARALTSHSLNVHCGHDDVMGVADRSEEHTSELQSPV